MICFNCGYKLPSTDIKECPLCGMKFPLKCHSCTYPNPALAKFCFNCGTLISNTDVLDSAQGSGELTENRKSVAVIFADISGFTALSEKMDPEEVRELINDCFQYITKPVYELEGTIDKYIGDCVMILFGAKYSHNDDPKRAIMCAIKMRELVQEFSKERLSNTDLSLDLSIGVNYGLVVTGSVGNYFDKDYTVIGDIVNTAQRLQTSAGKGVILVSESIYLETKDVIHYSEAREIAVKNKEKPVKCYSPVGIKKVSAIEDGLLIERENEINQMNTIYNSRKDTQYIIVTGEPGIGKTSLVKNFISKLKDNTKKVWVNSSPMFQNRAYYIISNVLFNIMNIGPEDSGRVKRNRLASYIDYLLKDYSEEEVQRNYNFISLIMGLDRDNEFQNVLNSMSYSDIEREIQNQVSMFFENLCRKNSFVFIVEDIQWADSGSMKIMSSLIKVLKGVKTTFIFSSRHELEGDKSWDGNNVHFIKLGELSEDGVYNLLCRLLNCSKVHKGLLDAVIKFANGNPLYIIEFITAIKRKHSYIIENDAAFVDESEITSLPNTIGNLILNNLSGLNNNEIEFLQAASVAGKEFNLSWVKGILSDNTIDKEILKLLQMNIISLVSTRTSYGIIDKVYTFNQDMVRETVYNSILNKNKRELHRKLGEFIESRHSGEIENYYEILYIHFEKSGLAKKANEYLYKTALKYKDNYNYSSSLEYFSKLIEKSDIGSTKNNGARAVRIFMDMGYIYMVISDYNKALEYFDKALKIATLADDIYFIKIMIAEVYKEKGMCSDALFLLDEIQPKIRQGTSIYGKLLQLRCSILRIMGNHEAIEVAKRSEKVLLKNKDYENLSETMIQAAMIYFLKGNVDNSLFYLNKAYKYAERVNNLRAMSRISGNLGIIYHSSGMISKALDNFTRSIELSQKISNIQSLISGNLNLGILYMEKGLFNKSEILFKKSLERSRQISSAYRICVVLFNLGDLMYEKGYYDEAFGYYNESLEIANEYGFPALKGINYIGISRLQLKSKSFEKIPEMLDKANEIFSNSDELSCISDYYRCRSVYDFINENIQGALENCEKSISAAVESKNDMRRLKALRLKGNILVKTGEYGKAIELYNTSISLAEQLESDYESAKGYFRKYCTLYITGNKEEAEFNLQKARDAIGKVDKCRWTSIIEQGHEIR